MVHATRRHALGLLGSTLLSPLLHPLPARAAWMAAAAAAMAAASQLVEMMKQGGSMELLVRSLDVKLDAIMDNQLRTMAALAAIDQKINDIQKLVAQTSIETLGLSAQIGAAAATKNVIESRRDNSKAAYERYCQQVFDEAGNIQASAQSLVTTPSVAVAAWHSLNGLTFIKTQDYGSDPIRIRQDWLSWNDEKKKALLRAKENLRQTFEMLVSPASLMSQRLADTRNRIAAIEKEIAANPAARYILPSSYAEVQAHAQLTATPTPSGNLTLCTRRREPDVVLDGGPVYTISDPSPGDTPRMHHHIEGHMALVRESVSHRRMPITVSGQVVPGGRQVVFVDVAPADQWKRGVWSRDVNKTSRTVVSAELDGCVELNPLNADELPVSLVTLGDLLDARNALVVVEGNLVNLQTLCQRALKRCEEIDRSKA